MFIFDNLCTHGITISSESINGQKTVGRQTGPWGEGYAWWLPLASSRHTEMFRRLYNLALDIQQATILICSVQKAV